VTAGEGGRRVLVTGADTFWGGRMVQALEEDPRMEVILGTGLASPSVQFDRAEFVRADQTYSILSRIVRATQVDTVIHTFLVVDSTLVRPRALHEINVIGTMNLLAAAGASGSPVRHVVMKSSSLVYGSSAEDPNTFHEDTPRSGPARTRVERSLLEAESLVRDFADDNPATTVTVLRFANVLGTDIVTAISKNLSRPLCPSILGYDPLVQFVEEDDVVRALEFVTSERVPGVFNVAGEGRLPWSEVAALCGTRLLPLPPFHPSWALGPLVRLGVYGLPPELEALLRYGRGMDTSRLAAAGFRYRYTSAGTVRNFVRAARLRRGAGREPASYTYEHDVEQFFRHSPSVVRPSEG
jgi:UDP-glucose 4-epimerase